MVETTTGTERAVGSETASGIASIVSGIASGSIVGAGEDDDDDSDDEDDEDDKDEAENNNIPLGDDDEDDDEMYEEARACVIEAGRASTSYLQRKLKLGYARAARLIDILEERGVIGPGDGAKPREVLEKGAGAPSDEEA